MRVLLTQPAPRVDSLASRLRQSGHEVACLPATRIESLLGTLDVAVLQTHVQRAACVIFVSPSAIDVLLEPLSTAAVRWPRSAEIAVVGPGSVEALAERGLDASVTTIHVPPRAPFDSAALLALPRFGHPPLPGDDAPLLVVTGETGRSDWIDILRERGFEVDVLVAYRSRTLEADAAVLELLQGWLDQRRPMASVFTSSDAAARLSEPLAELRDAAWLFGRPALTIHPRIAEVLTDNRWRDVRLIPPGESRLAGAIESLG